MFFNSGLSDWEFSTNRFDTDGSFLGYVLADGTFPTNSFGGSWFYGTFGNLPSPNVVNGGTLVTNTPVYKISSVYSDSTVIGGFGLGNHGIGDDGSHVVDFWDYGISNGVYIGGFESQHIAGQKVWCGVLNLTGYTDGTLGNNLASEFINNNGIRGRIIRYKGATNNALSGVYEVHEAQLSDNTIWDYMVSDEYGHNYFGNLPHALADGGNLHQAAWNNFWGTSSNGVAAPMPNVLIVPSGAVGVLPTVKTN
jgi:hypothetical protein